MEENKLYYTPDLEEFCINFEYEILETKSVYDNDWKFNVKKLVFNKETIKTNFQLFDILHYYNQKQLRVKYLDKEDIESLGWKDGENYGLSGYVLNYATDDSYQMYYDEDNQFTQIYNWNSKIIFEGIIKNKSELKRLLKQLDINE